MTNTGIKKQTRGSQARKRVLVYFVLIFLTLLCLIPFYILIINATRAHPDIQKGFSAFPGSSLFYNLNNILHNENLPVLSGIQNSLFISILNALFATYFSAMAAFGLHAYEFRGKKLAFSFIMLIMMVPTQVYSLGFIRQMTTMGLKNSFIPLIVPAAAAPTVVFFMKQYLIGALPLEIVEAARIDGSSELRTFNTVVLPMMKPALAVQAIFTFVAAWNNYFLPALLIDSKNKKTLPILIAQLRSADFLKFDMGQVYMMILIAIIPIVLVYLCLARFIVGGVTLGSVKG